MSDGRVVIDILADSKQYQATVAGLSAETNKVVAGMAAGMKTAGMGLTLALTAPLLLFGAYSVKAAMDFESSFAGVRKTTNATEAEFEKLAQASKRMATEKVIDANAVNHVMELGSQLGITKNNLVDFAGVIADLDVSTNLNTEEAATQMARYANITGMAQGEFDRFGSTLAALGNTSATTESDIMSMSMRIAGSASQVGMADDQILALAASLSSVGIEAEMGGTAISTVISQIDKDVATNGSTLSTWADTCGMSVAEFKRAWETDAAGAMQSLFAGMNAASESGGNLNLVLDQMGITSLRQGDMMKRMSNASVLLGASFGTANVAWNENTALARESEQRYMTTESQAKILGNQLQNVASTMGGPLLASVNAIIGGAQPFLDVLKSGAEGFAHMDKGQRNLVVGLALVAAGIGPTLLGLSKFLTMTNNVAGGAAKLATALAAEKAAMAASQAASQASAVGFVRSLGTKTTAQTASTVSLKFNSAEHQKNAAAIIANMQANLAENTAKTTNTAATGVNTASTTANTAAKSAGAAATATDAAATTASTGVKSVATVATNVLTGAQVAFNAALKANPIGVVLIAVGALAAALAGLATIMDNNSRENTELSETSKQHQAAVSGLRGEYEQACSTFGDTSNEALKLKASLDEQTASFDAGKQTVRQMYEECDKAVQAHKDLRTELDGNTDAANNQAGEVLLLAGRIEDLGDKTDKTAADEAVLVSLLEEAKQTIPGVTAEWDANGKVMTQSTEIINKLAAAEANRIKAKAHTDNYNKYIAEQASLEEQLAKASAQLNGEEMIGVKVKLDAEKRVDELNGALRENKADQDAAKDAANRDIEAQKKLTEAVKAVTDGRLSASDAAKQFGADEAMVSAMVEQSQAAQKQAVVEAKSEMRKSIDDYISATPAFKQALSDAGMSVEDLAVTLEGQGITMDEAASAIERYSDRAANGFTRISDSSKNTLDELYQTLAYNLEATQNWGTNLESVFGRTGVSFSSEFVSAVRRGGVEEYGTVMAQMANLSDAELQGISDAYAANGKAGVDNYLTENRLLVPGIHEALAGASEAVDAELKNGTDAAGTTATETGTAYSENLKASISTCPQDVQQYISQVEQQLQQARASAGEAGTGTGSNYTESLKASISSCPQDVQAYIAQLQANLQSLEGVAGTSGSTSGTNYSTGIGTGISSGIASQADNVNAAMALMTSGVGSYLNLAASGSYSAGVQVGSGVSSGISSQLGAVQGSVAGLAGVITAAVSAIQLQPVGANITIGLAAGISCSSPVVSASLANIRNIIMMQMLSVHLQPIGSAMIAQLASGMMGESGAVSAASSYIASTIITTMQSVAGQSYDIGLNIDAGLASGIYAGAGSVSGAISSVVSSAVATAKSDLQIKSPSRVFAAIGRRIPQGLAMGIVDESAMVNNAVNSVLNDAVSSARRDVNTSVGALGTFGESGPSSESLRLVRGGVRSVIPESRDIPVLSSPSSNTIVNNYYRVGDVDVSGDQATEQVVENFIKRLAVIGGLNS